MSSITFSVIDLTCEQADQSFFPPRVALTTKSTTTIATLYGWSEYSPSSPPKKYHKLTYDGTATQTGRWSFTQETFEWYLSNNVPITEVAMANARYVYGGTAEIDSKGNQISHYTKNYYASCTKFSPFFDTNLFTYPFTLKGYCWKYDPGSCPTCEDPPPFVANFQSNNTKDLPYDFVSGSQGITGTQTSLAQDFDGQLLVHMQNGGSDGANNFPPATWNGIQGPWPFITTNIHMTATLSDEYTDSEALQNAQVIVSNGTTSENLPRTTGFVSRYTGVVYTLNCSNLLVGKSYIATVHFRDQSFVKSIRTYTVNAVLPTATIIDVIPQPFPGNTTTVVSAEIAFAP